jgi:hypothetical protein
MRPISQEAMPVRVSGGAHPCPRPASNYIGFSTEREKRKAAPKTSTVCTFGTPRLGGDDDF